MCLEGDKINEKKNKKNKRDGKMVGTCGSHSGNIWREFKNTEGDGWASGSGLKVMVFRTSRKQTEIFTSQDHSCRSIHLSLKQCFCNRR